MRHYVVPARGGSKTVPDKNVRLLGNVPLLGWTVAAARAAAEDEARVIVNSDDTKILDIAEGLGALAYKRPDYLGGDETSMRDVVKDHFRRFEDCSEIVLLFPTSPFRTADSIRRAVQLFAFRGAASLMSVTPHNGRPYGGVMLVNGQMDYADGAEAFYRKQETPLLYFANGAIFIIARGEEARLNTQLFNRATVPFVLEGFEALDVDTEHDLALCQAVVKAGLVPVTRLHDVLRTGAA